MNTLKKIKEAQIVKIYEMIATLTEIKNKLIRQLADIDKQPTKGDWYILKDKNMYYQYLSTTNGEVALVRHENINRVKEEIFKDYYVKAAADDVVRHIKYLNSKKRSYVKVDPKIKAFSDSMNAISFDVDRNIAHIHDLLEDNMVRPNFNPSNLLFGKAGTGMSYIDVIEAAKAKKAFDPNKCDFYMVNIANGNGSKVRHDSYEKAEREAIRLCDTFKTEAFILGVVASVKPVEERKVTVVIKPTVVKR